ncbi:MAG: DUF4105 domain-containing protein [Gammaproteobacteria bacterium PRO8]|nr:DUF4105 domain-containing protein [Gammaproteobacteria bacterium PRO8]
MGRPGVAPRTAPTPVRIGPARTAGLLPGLLGLLLATASPANPAAPATDTDSPTVAALAGQREWLQLLHYTPSWLPGRLRNFVDDPDFFLSPRGPHDPAAELAATLDALRRDPATQCRFPARRQWLVAQLPGLAATLPAAHCPEYEEWRRVLAVREAVLVFASSYLNSPSSMYGHTFLRFDSAAPERRTPLLAWALNFGATVPPDENGFVYAWRGLFGGYPGQFAAGPYFEKLREYSRLESRDLWEYRLNLDAAELDRLLAHAWELRAINFDYYFFDENCSLRLLELLDVARPGHDLADQFPNYAIPIDTVRAVIDAGMVTDVAWRPATRSTLRWQIAQLDAGERQLARRLADDAGADPQAFAALEPARQRLVAEVAYQYLRDRAVHAVPDAALARQNFALLQLLERTAAATAPPAPPRPAAPETGHRTGLAALAAGTEESRAFGDLEWRISYHDLLDPPAGYPAGASLNMARMVLRLKEGGTLQLQRLDALEITSLAARDQFFRSWSWRVNAGLERQWTDGDDILVTQANGGFGGSWAPLPSLLLFALGTGRLEVNHALDRSLDLALGLAAGLRLESPAGITLASADFYHFTGGEDRRALALRHELALGANLGLRLQLERRVNEHDRVDEASLALRYHF